MTQQDKVYCKYFHKILHVIVLRHMLLVCTTKNY
jgi:hypothetical protein